MASNDSLPSQQLFSLASHARSYFQLRPAPPDSLITEIINFLSVEIPRSEHRLAIDVGCGSGQCTNALGPYFKHVVGTDCSEEQIREASASPHPPTVEYRVAPAENTEVILGASRAQLVTACQSYHWFNEAEFWSEIEEILVPGGVVALLGYISPVLEHEKLAGIGAKIDKISENSAKCSREYPGRQRLIGKLCNNLKS